MADDSDCTFDPQYASHYLHHLSHFGVVLGIGLCIGTMLSMLPQHIKFLTKKSSAGVSYLMLFMGNVNQFSAVINTTIMKFHELQACREVPWQECLPSLLTFFQMLVLWAFYFPLFIWFLVFLDREERVVLFRASRLFVFFIVYATVLTMVMVIMLKEIGPCHETKSLAYGLGSLCTFVNLTQWAPQIYHTYRAKRAGSLSMLMLSLQGPGSLVIVYFLAIVSHESVSIWISTLTSALQQLILLGMLLYYKYTRPGKTIEYLPEAELGEDTEPLLPLPQADRSEGASLISPRSPRETIYVLEQD
eukprot:Rmarinus@m.9981